MVIIFFCSESDEKAMELFSRTAVNIPEDVVLQRYVSVEHLKGVLHDAEIREAFIIIAAFHEEALIDAYFINDLLCRYNSIVILPDRGKLSTALGHVLRPARTFYSDSDLNDILSVIRECAGGPSAKNPSKQVIRMKMFFNVPRNNDMEKKVSNL
ncbi:MAG: hypothetical protein A4E64_01532 [Syntrophorhabdus sp. PtaU1.Bin058]|nr:MAG: hypothetical protein A4E64_01532 [Syntrophorhabdus sp. PtaU1.Bin058]